MRKLCLKLVPRLLTVDQKQQRVNNNKQIFLKIFRKLPLTVRNNFVAGSFPKSKIYSRLSTGTTTKTWFFIYIKILFKEKFFNIFIFWKYWFSTIFYDKKLSVFNFCLKNYYGYIKIVLRSEMRHDKFYKTVFLFLWMTENNFLSRFSCVENSFPPFRTLGKLLLVAFHFCHCCDRIVTRCIVLVKEHFYLLHLGFFFSKFHPSNQICY